MIITDLHKFCTRISIIQEIPHAFFSQIETSMIFGDTLFPTWEKDVFEETHLRKKFEAVYDKYKSIPAKADRDKVCDSFVYNNRIEDLCLNQNGSTIIELNDLHNNIRAEIDELFLYLFNTAINYHKFNTYVSDTLKEAINRFIKDNGLEVCPFCGLESFMNVEGQARIALDHWLCKDLFPMSAVNFDNLFPIGSKCNERPAKGSKNILINNPTSRNRIQAYYPYLSHSGVKTVFNFINEPSIAGISDTDWKLVLTPVDTHEQSIFESWEKTFNINDRYLSFYVQNIFPMWENDYKRFIEEAEKSHAQTVIELKKNFTTWRASFPIKGRPGAILYRSFINFLINNASEAYLYGLCENFKR